MKIAFWQRPDGSVGRLIPANNVYIAVDADGNDVPSQLYHLDNDIDGYRKLTIDDIARRDINPADMAPDTSYIVMDSEDQPDGYFRNAFSIVDDEVVIDMDKAAEVQKEKLRLLRAPELAALDVDYQRALETADTKTMESVVERKNALRDVTKDQAITSATTPDELKLAGLDVINLES